MIIFAPASYFPSYFTVARYAFKSSENNLFKAKPIST